MKIIRRIIIAVVALYLLSSAAITAAYNLLPAHAWDIARHRNGLLIFAVDNGRVYLLSPFDNYGDSWL